MKPQSARWIFYTGTTLSLVLFLGLTADTHRQVRVLTHADRLTDQVVAGKKVWHKYNCNDCHTILGFGSYYGPDLTMVYRRRGPERIQTAVMTPEKVTTWRKMPHLPVSEAELADLVAFFAWVGEIDTHDWPPQDRRLRTTAGRALALGISTGAELFREKGCFECHRIEQVGSAEGLDLSGVGSRLTGTTIDSLLADPVSVNPKAEMPRPELTEAERAELVRFLSGLRGIGGGNGP